ETRYDEVTARDAEIPGGIPTELQQLYAEFDGFRFSDTNPFFYPLESIKWVDRKLPETDVLFRHRREIGSAWSDAQYFIFGQTCTGDELTYCMNSPRGKDGLIVTLDHEQQGPANDPEQPCFLVVVAESLAEWLERWMEFDLIEYSWCT